MSPKFIGLILCFSLCSFVFAGQEKYSEQEVSVNKFIDGTLTKPAESSTASLVIFIQGSGPTDRNGNQPMMKNDGIRKIARQLAENGIASYRFDKRIFKMDELKIREEDLRFEDFVEDVTSILAYFREKDEFENLIIAGHSEGSLVGMLAAKDNADAFISLAGAGQSIDHIIAEQVGKQAPGLQENTRQALDELKTTGHTTSYDPVLQSIFRPSAQPYLASWIQYNPAEEIAKLEMPVLIINGTSDIQVEIEEAEILNRAATNAQLEIIENMNHVFREIRGEDDLANAKAYNESARPLHPELIPVLTQFIKAQEQ